MGNFKDKKSRLMGQMGQELTHAEKEFKATTQHILQGNHY